MAGRSISTIRRIVSIVMGVILVGSGLLFLLVSIFMFADAEADTGVFAMLVSLMNIVSGVLLLLAMRDLSPNASAAASAPTQPVTIPQSMPLSYPGPDDTNPKMVPVQNQAPVAAPQRGISTQAAFEKLILRSSDVLATLKDVCANGGDDRAMLSRMLRRTGLMAWADSPKITAAKLRRNGRFWLNTNVDSLDAAEFDRSLAIEAALNLDQDSIGLPQPSDEGRITHILAQTLDLNPEYSDKIGQVNTSDITSPTDGEWNCRLRISDFVENAPAPFRISFDMQSNLRAGLVELVLDIPRPASMSVLTDNLARQIVAARAYALRSALLLARAAFSSSQRVKRVVVHCNALDDSGERQTYLRVHVSRETLQSLVDAARNPAVDVNGFPRTDSIEATFDSQGWFVPIAAWAGFTNPELEVQGRFDPVEAMSAECPDALFVATGARTYRDLGINESGVRVAAWRAIKQDLGGSTESAVSALLALRNSARNLSVVEAADRTSKALVNGSVDATDLDALRALFVEGSSLDVAVKKARSVWDEDPDPDLYESTIKQLEAVLSPVTEMGIYLDDADSVYRYFNNVSERFAYNKAFANDARRVRLVPDSYYFAHSTVARLYARLERFDEALEHADELLRIAPMTTDAALVKVRILEDASRVYEAASLLKEFVDKACSARDMAICLYRLAFMEWKLGRSDLAVACYQRSINLFPSDSAQAEEELRDLLAGDSSLKAFENDEAVRKALSDAGIPYGPVGSLRTNAFNAAIACIDSNIFTVGRPALNFAIETNRDDALSDVSFSLKPLS